MGEILFLQRFSYTYDTQMNMQCSSILMAPKETGFEHSVNYDGYMKAN